MTNEDRAAKNAQDAIRGLPHDSAMTFPSTADARTTNNVMRHEYRVLTAEEKAFMQSIKDHGLLFHTLLVGMGESRELSLAKTKIEEAVMWAIKSITK